MIRSKLMLLVPLFLVTTFTGCQREQPAADQKKEGAPVATPAVVPMDDLVRALAYEVFGFLQDYIQVHNDMIGRQPLEYQQPIDFERNTRKLTQIDQLLQNAKFQALSMQRSPQALARHREYLRVLVSYVEALAYTVSLLHNVAANLSQEARGGHYAMNQYLQDMDKYKTSVERYKTAGEKLKVAWDNAGL